jgi:hypothetical protein
MQQADVKTSEAKADKLLGVETVRLKSLFSTGLREVCQPSMRVM